MSKRIIGVIGLFAMSLLIIYFSSAINYLIEFSKTILSNDNELGNKSIFVY